MWIHIVKFEVFTATAVKSTFFKGATQRNLQDRGDSGAAKEVRSRNANHVAWSTIFSTVNTESIVLPEYKAQFIWPNFA
jgi:hypothetical protein